MKLEKITLRNYKSFGEKTSLFLGNQDVISIIGKNESGKSNLLDAIGMLKFSPVNKDYQNYMKTNRTLNEETTEIKVLFSLNSDEKKVLNTESGTSKLAFSREGKVVRIELVEGAINEYFKREQYKELISVLSAPIKEKLISISRQDDKTTYNNRINKLINAEELLVRNYNEHLNWLENNIGKKLQEPNERKDYSRVIKSTRNYFKKCFDLFPIFFKYNEINIKDSYPLNDDFFKNIDKNNPEVVALLNAGGLSINDLQIASQDNGHGLDKRDEIGKAIKEKIEKPFNLFYSVEPIKIRIDFFNNSFSMNINSGSGNMNISERSNGLRWYLNFFIKLLDRGLLDKNVVFLIDEPGIRLHVEAQKKLLELFNSDTTFGKDTQVIYTTHSPFMIDIENVNSIRVIEKQDGQSKILVPYSDKIDKASRLESLSPLLNAFGMKLSDNIGFDQSKVNVITEGISDFIYLNSMKKVLNIENCVIIPGNGADNVELLALILWGWGLDFMIMFDNDAKGRSCFNKLKDKFRGNISDSALKGPKVISVDIDFDKDGNRAIEDLISAEDYEILEMDYSKVDNRSRDKVMYAHNFYTKVVDEEIEISSDTKKGFSKIFDYIESYSKN